MSISAPADTSTDTAPDRTKTDATKTFADFGVEKSLCDSLAEVGIIHPFPIQELTLPLALTGADIIGQARTGTGKTLGFGLPLLQRVDTDESLQALVIVPTRELCLQVAEDLTQAGRGRGVKVVAVYGGKSMQPQIDALEGGAHVVVGTPGRLLDLSRRGHLDLSRCTGLVLDEADEMLDLGFLPDVEALIEQCAEERQTQLFSATMPAQIVGLARRYMRKPTFMRAEVEEVRIAPETRQFFFSCHRMDKPAVLARILQTPSRGLCVVFCRTKRMADQLAEELRQRDVAAQAIHSDLRQEARERALQKFRDGKTTVLCATEVAARGLDIDDVTHVVNYDCPDDEKMYLHRIGRTGRAGAQGVAITFAVWNELPRLEMIRRELDIDEEIHEVFSTSPLLEELFDLPVREERTKVPSPPKARTGKASRSRKRQESRKGQDSDTREESDTTQDSQKRDSGKSKRPRSTAEATAGDEGEQQRSRVRRRTRRRSTDDDGGPAQDTPERDGPEQDGPEQDRSEQDSPEQDSLERRRSGQGRSRGRAEESKAQRSDRGRERRSDRGTSSKKTARTRSSAEETPAEQGRSDRGRPSGGSRSRSDSGGGRDRRERDGGSRGRRPTERSGRKGGRRGPQVSPAEARGSGRPRLRRKMEVVHLP